VTGSVLRRAPHDRRQLRRSRPDRVENFKFVKRTRNRTAKQTMPSPPCCCAGGRSAVSSEAYPDLEEFYADTHVSIAKSSGSSARPVCRYVQLDDTNFALLCDRKLAESFAATGTIRMNAERSQTLINSVVAAPAGMAAEFAPASGIADHMAVPVRRTTELIRFGEAFGHSSGSYPSRRKDSGELRIAEKAKFVSSSALAATGLAELPELFAIDTCDVGVELLQVRVGLGAHCRRPRAAAWWANGMVCLAVRFVFAFTNLKFST